MQKKPMCVTDVVWFTNRWLLWTK